MKQTFLDNQTFILFCLILSVMRIYLEVVGFNFARLPITNKMPEHTGRAIHKWGFYMSVGYFVLFAPEFLLS
jgi:hypothetical protein